MIVEFLRGTCGESHAQSGRAAFHRARPRSREASGEEKVLDATAAVGT
jgi:hypothetical protein